MSDKSKDKEVEEEEEYSEKYANACFSWFYIFMDVLLASSILKGLRIKKRKYRSFKP